MTTFQRRDMKDINMILPFIGTKSCWWRRTQKYRKM